MTAFHDTILASPPAFLKGVKPFRDGLSAFAAAF
jgi:hypothetical protein